MTTWNSLNYTSIYLGSGADTGTGDNLLTAFTKVDNNFANINVFLQQGSTSTQAMPLVNANVTGTLNANLTVASGPVVLAKFSRTQLLNNGANIANVTAGVAYNTTTNVPVYFNGTNWVFFSNNAVI
jgi:short-subunit dehydrogenase involved in D-alanine esterification of teichoic acids